MNIVYLIYGIVVVILIVLASLFTQGNQSDKLVRETKRQTEEQTKILTEQNKKILKLEEQNNELQRLNICLAQFIIGGDFTDRAECQDRINQGIAGTSGQPSQINPPQGGSQGQNPVNPQNPPNPPPPPPEECTINLLGVCI